MVGAAYSTVHGFHRLWAPLWVTDGWGWHGALLENSERADLKMETVPELALGLDNGDPTGLVDGWERGPGDAVAGARQLSRRPAPTNEPHSRIGARVERKREFRFARG